MQQEIVDKELAMLKRFVEVYCHHHDHCDDDGICEQCRDLFSYARRRLENCPYDPKPKCKNCRTHCYSQQYRQMIKDVMRFSGMHFIKRGRVDWLIRYFYSMPGKPGKPAKAKPASKLR